MTLAYIGPGPGFLIDFKGPGPYLLGAAALILIVVFIRVFRGREES
jgi:hypothetical protein